MPKLIIKLSGYKTLEVCEMEQARNRLDFEHGIFLVDGKRINSYEELAALASQERYANQEFIELVLLPPISGG
jgi:hypothetical protein